VDHFVDANLSFPQLIELVKINSAFVRIKNVVKENPFYTDRMFWIVPEIIFDLTEACQRQEGDLSCAVCKQKIIHCNIILN
jgi:hypothetical protein